jgi:hypothetical protein
MHSRDPLKNWLMAKLILGSLIPQMMVRFFLLRVGAWTADGWRHETHY